MEWKARRAINGAARALKAACEIIYALSDFLSCYLPIADPYLEGGGAVRAC